MFIPDIIVMNSPSELRTEQRQEDREKDEKRRKVEELRKMKEDGVITEEEFQKELMNLL